MDKDFIAGFIIVAAVWFLFVGPASAARTETRGQITTYRCLFEAGPRIGQIVDFYSYKDVAPILIGFPCQDGDGSFGVGISDMSDRPPPAPDGQNSVLTANGMTLMCRFKKGPRSEETRTFAPPVLAFLVGADCSDGAGDDGVAVTQ